MYAHKLLDVLIYSWYMHIPYTQISGAYAYTYSYSSLLDTLLGAVIKVACPPFAGTQMALATLLQQAVNTNNNSNNLTMTH